MTEREVGTEEEAEAEARRRYAHVFDEPADYVAGLPISLVRDYLASVDAQLDTYVALGFYTQAEADELGARQPA